MKSLDKKKTKKLDWEIELYTLLNKHADKTDFYWTQLGEDLTKLISSLLQKPRTELLEEILGLECLKEEDESGWKGNSFDNTGNGNKSIRNQLRKEIRERLKQL